MWQPIETAPKDDSAEILIWTGDSMFVARWAYETLWQPEGMPAMRPTHWTPLPPPPGLAERHNDWCAEYVMESPKRKR